MNVVVVVKCGKERYEIMREKSATVPARILTDFFFRHSLDTLLLVCRPEEPVGYDFESAFSSSAGPQPNCQG